MMGEPSASLELFLLVALIFADRVRPSPAYLLRA
jgi:hypothetical protein